MKLGLPTDIQQLLAGPISCSEETDVKVNQDRLRRRVLDVLAGYEDGPALLHRGAVALLAVDNPDVLDGGLACLFVIGTVADLDVIEALLSHQSERVRISARTCMFEIRERRG